MTPASSLPHYFGRDSASLGGTDVLRVISPTTRPWSPWLAGRAVGAAGRRASTGQRGQAVSVVLECGLDGTIEYVSPSFATLFRYLRATISMLLSVLVKSSHPVFPTGLLRWLGGAVSSIAPAAVVGTKGERWFVDVQAWQHVVQRLLEDPSTNTVVDTTLSVIDRDGQV